MYRDLVRPRRWQAGDRVAAVTLSWGGPGTFPHRYEAGRRQLQDEFGVEVITMPHTLDPPDEVADNPAARVDDLHRAFADPDIAGVLSTIGGDESIRLLPLLDLDLLAANPKVLLGYSDTTITQMALLRAGLVSFYGPAVLSGFGENAGMHDYLVRGVRTMLFDPPEDGVTVWPENDGGWTVEMLDWGDPSLQQQRRTLRPTTGWRWHGGSLAQGPVIAVCMEALDMLRGSEWWPDLDGAVLALETSEEAPPPEVVAQFLRNLALMGDLHGLAGIVLGRPGGADLDPADHPAYDQAVLRVVRDEEHLDDMPVVTGVDFGHTDPMWTVPIGIPLRIDPNARQLTFTAAGVESR